MGAADSRRLGVSVRVGVLMRVAVGLAAALCAGAAGPARAQTAATPAAAANAQASDTKPAGTKPAGTQQAGAPAADKTVAGKTGAGKTGAGKTGAAKAAGKPLGKTPAHAAGHSAAHKPPVVAPKHATPVRKPVHPDAKLKSPPARTSGKAAKPTADAKPDAKAAKPKPPPAPAKPAPPPDIGTVTGLHIPRYVSLKTDEVNMRVGPATRFPIMWTYQRQGLPVRILREVDVWRLVTDMDGVTGWVHTATLNGRRGFVVTGTEPRSLRAAASEDAGAVATLKPGVVGRLRACAAGAEWCEVEVAGYRGFLRRDWFWGSDPGELVAP